MEHVDAIVIGAGVVGCAIARQLAARGVETVLVDRADRVGTETTARNSGVIHAGLYYPPGSLKAALCVRGRQLLYAYAAKAGVPHRRCGKLIVATSPDQTSALHAIEARAVACGVHDLRRLTRAEACGMEPALACDAALHSPQTGIIDSHALVLALLAEAEGAGAVTSLNTEVTAVRVLPDGFAVETRDVVSGDSFALQARRIVNAAGLHASAVAQRIAGLAPGMVPETRYARGNYFTTTGRPPFSHLIYPVPEPGGLGVHLTLDLDGGARFGPDVEWIDRIDYSVNAARADHFSAEIRKYWPGLPADGLTPAYAGIRPKLSGPGAAAADFRIDGPEVHGVTGLVNLFGIESPGLTAALAIAEVAVARLFPA